MELKHLTSSRMLLPVFVGFLFLSACKVPPSGISSQNETQGEMLQAVLKEVFVIDPLPGRSPFQRNVRFEEFDGKTYLTLTEPTRQEIQLWDLETQTLVDTIDGMVYKNQYLINFHFISRDTLIFAFNYVYFGEYHDKVFARVVNKKVVDEFSMKDAPVVHKRGHIFNQENTMFAFSHHLSPLYNPADGSMITVFNPNYPSSDSLRFFPNWSFLGKVYLDSSKAFEPIYFCDQKQVIDEWLPKYPSIFKQLVGCSIDAPNGSFLVSFPFSDSLWEIDYATHKVLTRALTPSHLIDEVRPVGNHSMEDFRCAKYSSMAYDKQRGRLYRNNRIGVPDSASNQEKSNPFVSISVFDSLFNKIGEALLPHGYRDYTLIPYRNGVLLYDNATTISSGKRVYGYFELEKTGRPYSALDSQLQEARQHLHSDKTPLTYLEEITGSPVKDEAVLLIPTEKSCKACLESVGAFLEQYAGKLDAEKLRIVIIGSGGNAARFADKYRLQRSKPFFRDEDNRYMYAFEPWINPKMLFYSEGKLVSEQEYNPDEIPELVEKLKSYER
jgi:hypothetical protein